MPPEALTNRPQCIHTLHDGDIRIHVAGRYTGVEMRVALHSAKHGSASTYSLPVLGPDMARDVARALMDAAAVADGAPLPEETNVGGI